MQIKDNLSGNYNAGRPRGIDRIIIHVTEGGYQSSIDWLKNPNVEASCHYIINASGTEITRLVKDGDTAWHAGNLDMNYRSIGIEHTGYTAVGNFSEGLYRAGAELTAKLCKQYGIPADRQHILAHAEVPYPNNHTDPGPKWDWSKFMSYVKEYYNAGEILMNSEILNGHILANGFRDYFYKFGGVYVFGLPLTDEFVYDKTGLTTQVFERMVLEYDPNEPNINWRVRGKLVGAYWMEHERIVNA